MITYREFMKSGFYRLHELRPMPWRLDESNNARVVVKDAKGNTVLHEEFDFPDEMGSSLREEITESAKLLAEMLVSGSLFEPNDQEDRTRAGDDQL